MACNSCDKQLSKKSQLEKSNLKKRLNRIEGQVKGIQRMLEEDKYCVDILVQISAVRSALDKVGGIILENHMRGCIHDSFERNDENKEEVLDELVDTVLKFMK